MANTTLSRSISSSPTNPDKFTVSMWVKKSKIGAEQVLLGNYSSGNFRGKIDFLSDDRLEYIQKNDGNTTANLITTRKFRDTSAWYHLVYQFDTTQGTSSNRIKLYVNGVQETAFDTASYPAQNLDMRPNQASTTLHIGSDGNSGNYFNGVLSHFHLVDGYIEAPTVFGETDSTTGEWKINTTPSISEYGDDGFFVLKDGNSVTDQSGKGNNFTVASGTLTKTEDCPSNVFATGNILLKPHSNITFSNGNNTAAEGGSDWGSIVSTIGASSGKYYAEVKCASGSYFFTGITSENSLMSTAGTAGFAGKFNYGVGYKENGQYRKDAGSYTSYGSTYTNGDIIGIAMDLDNSKLYFSKNGTWQNSGVPTSGSTGTGAISITATSTAGNYFLVASPNTSTVQFNFGNGYFGTTAVASAGTNASGIGIFEYDVPTGYTALSTKGLNL